MRRIPQRHLCAAACALSILGAATAASAQNSAPSPTPALALDRYYPAPPGDRMFGVQSPDVPGEMSPLFSVVSDYAHDPLVLQTARTAEDRGTVVGAQLFLHLQAGLAIRSRVFVHASFPIALMQQGNSPVADGTTFTSPKAADIGDLRVGLRVRFLGERADPIQLALGGYLWFPTAKGTVGTYLGEGEVRGMPQILLGGRLRDRMVWALSAGLDLRGSRVFGGPNGASQGTMLRLDGGLGVLVGDKRALQIGIEGNAAFLLANETGTPAERSTNLEALLGAKYRFLRDFEIGAGAGPGLTSGIGTPDVRAVGSIAFTPEIAKEPRPADEDGDGISDARDACPNVKGLTRSDPARNGCPDSDADGDGVEDQQDGCPTVKGLTRSDPKMNGCPDPDQDADGIADPQDACPTVPGPERADPIRSGCPDVDSDADGVLDEKDACPHLRGVATSDAATNGCPGDTDGDGIRDDKDACPEEKGEASSDATKNGCPEAVRVTLTEVVILKEVEFDTSRATIKMVSYKLLDEVASVLKQHPELLRLEVQGHTDDQGKADFNKQLSQDRAESVKKALVQRGVAEERLSPKGYGQERPIADNKTPKGRQKNRRVQFVIFEKVAKAKARSAP